jgi:hypothetical protein
MGLTNYPNGLTSFGIPLVGGGLTAPPVTGGHVFWVGSATGLPNDAPSNGSSPDNPFATIDYAIGRCVAGRGDVILVLPGHTETVSAAGGITFDKAGVIVWGLGHGTARPTITLQSVDTATISVTAANCMLHNCIVDITAFDGIDIGITVAGQYFTLSNCYILGGDSGGQCDAMVATGATTTGTGFRAISNIFQASTTAGVVSGIDIVGTPDLWEIVGNRFFGVYSGAPVNNETSNIATNGAIEWNFLENKHATALAIDLDSACTGVIRYNTTWTTADPAGAGVAIDGGSMAEFENYSNSTVDTSGLLEPVLET